MSLITLSFYSPNDPTTLLGTLTEEECESIEIRKVFRGLGSGLIKADRRNVDPAFLDDRVLVKATIPLLSAAPRFAWRVENGIFNLINEQDDESVTWGGGGTLGILNDAALPIFPTNGNPRRGSATHEDVWWWRNVKYGAIALRMIEEGRSMPGAPLEHVATTFTRLVDSAGVPWGAVADEYEVGIGTNMYEAMAGLQDAGDFILRGQTNLTIDAFQSLGTDRTSATFAAGKVRIIPDNIVTDLAKVAHQRFAWTHIITKDKDGTFAYHVSPHYVAGTVARYGFIDANDSNDAALIAKMAQGEIKVQREGLDQVDVEIIPGNAPLSGLYLPTVHYDVGDQVTLHTGTDTADYNEKSLRVTGMRIVIGVADDTDADTRAKSLHTVLELNGRTRSNGSLDTGSSRGGGGSSGGGSSVTVIQQAKVPPGCIADHWVEGSEAAYGAHAMTGNDGGVVLVPIAVTADDQALAVFVEMGIGESVSAVKWRPTAGSAVGEQALTLRESALSGGAGNLFAYSLDSPTQGTGAGGAGEVRVEATEEATVGVIRIDTTSGYADSAATTSAGSGPSSVVLATEPGDFVAAGISSAAAGDTELDTGLDKQQFTSSHGDPQGLEIATQEGEETGNSTTATWSHTAASRGMAAMAFRRGGAISLFDGHADLVGSGGRRSRCDHAHHVWRTVAPTTADNRDAGYPDGTLWIVVDDLTTPTAIVSRWRLLDQVAGTWAEESGGGGGPHTHAAVDVSVADSGGLFSASDDVEEALAALAGLESGLKFRLDNGSTVLATGVHKAADLIVPFPCTLLGWSLVADQAGSIVLDLWKDVRANHPPTVADTITAADKPTLSSAIQATDAAPTGWTTALAKNDVIRINVDSVTTITGCTLVLFVRKVVA